MRLHLNSFTATQIWIQTSLLSTIAPLLYMLHCKHWAIWIFISLVASFEIMNKHWALLLLSASFGAEHHDIYVTLQYDTTVQLNNTAAVVCILTIARFFIIFYWLFFVFVWRWNCIFYCYSTFLPLIVVFFSPRHNWPTTAFCCSILLHDYRAALDLDVEYVWPDKKKKNSSRNAAKNKYTSTQVWIKPQALHLNYTLLCV